MLKDYTFFILGSISGIIQSFKMIKYYKIGLDNPTERKSALDDILRGLLILVLVLIDSRSLRLRYCLVWFITFYTPLTIVYFMSYLKKKSSISLHKFVFNIAFYIILAALLTFSLI